MISKLVFILCVLAAFIIGGLFGIAIIACMITGKQSDSKNENINYKGGK